VKLADLGMEMGIIQRIIIKTKHLLSIVIALFILSMASEHRLMAYADPGSGAMFVQIILAGIIGGLFRLRSFMSRFRFSNPKRESPMLPSLRDNVLTRTYK
jgi:hypothetical protein